jgi:hypothetical protein
MANAFLKKINKNEISEDLVEKLDESIFVGLTPRKVIFVKQYLLDLDRTRAATVAGYKASGARTAGNRLLKDQAVQAALVRIRSLVAKESVYNLHKCMEEVSFHISEAHRMRQMTAVSNLLKTKAQLAGLIDNKIDVNIQSKGQLVIQMVGIKPPPYAQNEIDVTPDQEKLPEPEDEDEK